MKLPDFKKPKNFRKGGFHTNPDICWEIVMYVAFALIVGILIFSFYLFMQTDKAFTVPDADINTQSTSVNREMIDKVLKYFSVREEKSAEILTSPIPFVDPSL
jgi:hypothetical protein